jgi:hypothetical protein
MSLPRKRIDWKQYDQFEGSDAAFARSIGMDPRNFHQYKKTRHLDEPTSNGNLPAIPTSQPIAVPSPPIATHRRGIAVYRSGHG